MSRSTPKAAPHFSVIRFVVFVGLALSMGGAAGGPQGLSGQLIGAGMLMLAAFAAVFDPLSPTPADARPRGTLEWTAFVAGMSGICLVFAGLYVMSR